MEKQQKYSFILAFFAGMLGALGVFVLGGALGYAAWQYAPSQAWLKDQWHAFTEQTFPLVDSTGSSDAVVSVADTASPAVVSLVVSKEVPRLERYFEETPSVPGFPSFFFPKYRDRGTVEEEVAGGTGFFISADGYLVTNHHVIDVEEGIFTVYTNDGKSYPATLIASDPAFDIAVLKVDASEGDFSFLAFGDSDAVRVGQTVVAIGNALGEYRNTVSVGVVSGLSRSVVAATGNGDVERLQDILQTDAAINPGNSGGPLLDLAGNVVGVNVAASVGSGENIGFALPANAVRTIVTSLQTYGKVVQPWMGVRSVLITPEYAKKNNLPVEYGAHVHSESEEVPAVVPESPADVAGIREGDIILRVDSEAVDASHDLAYLIRLRAPGDEVVLGMLRNGEELEVKVTLGERPE